MATSQVDPSTVPPAPREISPRARKLFLRYDLPERINLTSSLISLLLLMGMLVYSFPLLLNATTQWMLSAGYQSAQVQGTVQKKHTRQDKQGKTLAGYRLDIRYTYNQQAYTWTQVISAKSKWAGVTKGQTIPLVVSKLRPRNAHIVGTPNLARNQLFLVFIILLLSGILLAMCLYKLRQGTAQRRRHIKILRHGTATTAVITSRGEDRSTFINGVYPTVIAWQFEHQGETIQSGYSSLSPEDIHALGDVEDTVLLLFNPEDPQQSLPYLSEK